MIIVRRVHHAFIFQNCAGSRKHGDHIVRFERTYFAGHVRREADMQRRRLEVARGRVGHHFVEIHASGRGNFARDIEMNPGGRFQLGSAVELEIRLLAGVGIAHDFPGIAGHVGLVNENGSNGPFARGFFVFVNPAAVVSERLAGEKFRIVRGRLVDQHEQNLPFDIHTFVIVPVVFGRFDAVADVDNLGVNIGFGLLGLIVGNVFVEWFEVERMKGRRTLRRNERETRVGAGRNANHRNFLQIRPVVAGRFQPIERKLRRDIFGGNVAPTLAGAASFEKIVGEEANMGLDVVGTNALHGGDGGRGKVRTEAGFSARLYRLFLRRPSLC